MTKQPLISVLTPVYNTPLDVLAATISSVTSQDFTDWQMVLVNDASPDPAVRELLRSAAAADPRIEVVERATNGGIAAASQDALEAATGTFVALLDHDDLLGDGALTRVAEELRRVEDVDYLYTDEDKVDENGALMDAFLKPDWSPERLRGQMYTAHLSVLRTNVVRYVGGFRPGFDGSQDHDLVLRVTERARRIVHIPEVLYHWRVIQGSAAAAAGAKPYAWEAGRRAVEEHLRRVPIDGVAELGPVPGTYRVRRNVASGSRVSVIIPTRGSAGMVRGERRVFVVECVRTLVERSELPGLEIVAVCDAATPRHVIEALRSVGDGRVRIVDFDEPFNFSAKCNVGALHATGDILLFLNDDTEVPAGASLRPLVGPLTEPDVGMTGARLLFEDGRLQHGGHVYDGGDWYHARFFAGPDDYGPFASLLIAREASGLTAACVATKRDVFTQVGGFSEQLPVNFNDVDLSYKIRSAGYRLLWIPEATAFHFESQTREPTVLASEVAAVRARWGSPEQDRYFRQDTRV